MEPRQRAWCYFRNLVHTVYREIRHVGPPEDRQAKLRVADPSLLPAVTRCSENRQHLKTAYLFKKTAGADTVDDVVRVYYDVTGLQLQECVSLFDRGGWTLRYGGPKWATIARTTLELAETLRRNDLDSALLVCSCVRQLEHNSRRLVPSVEEWRSDAYLQEKWPELCD